MLVISKVDEIDVEKLIKMYNLSLLQTALFNSTAMNFEIEGNYKSVFRAIKFFGLMYEITKAGESVEVEVVGPASLVKMVRKYGVSMAKAVPHVISAKKWKINAKILEGDRLYELEIDSSSKHLFPDVEPEVKYDSSFEVEFFRRIRNLGYLVEREPGVINAGGKAFIPDFAIWKDGWSEKVYVEIAGFWTEDYLKRKVEKICQQIYRKTRKKRKRERESTRRRSQRKNRQAESKDIKTQAGEFRRTKINSRRGRVKIQRCYAQKARYSGSVERIKLYYQI